MLVKLFNVRLKAEGQLKFIDKVVKCVLNQGQFDAYVHSELKKLKQEYPYINYAVVLAYMPGKKTEHDDYSDTMLPEGIESVHLHYAIS